MRKGSVRTSLKNRLDGTYRAPGNYDVSRCFPSENECYDSFHVYVYVNKPAMMCTKCVLTTLDSSQRTTKFPGASGSKLNCCR